MFDAVAEFVGILILIFLAIFLFALAIFAIFSFYFEIKDYFYEERKNKK